MKYLLTAVLAVLVLAGQASAVTTTANGWMWKMTPEADGLTATFWSGDQFTLSEDAAGNLLITWEDLLPDVTANWDDRIRGWIVGPAGFTLDMGMRPAADLPFWFQVRDGDGNPVGELTHFELSSSERTGTATVATPPPAALPVPLPAAFWMMLAGLGALVGKRRLLSAQPK